MRRKFRKNLKGISTVIATIIIVAISIVMAIAVAYWALGIGTSFTRFEKIEFTSAYATADTTNYYIWMRLKNTGTAAATIDYSTIFYNGKPSDVYTNKPDALFNATFLDAGAVVNGTITLAKGAEWTPGMNVEVMIQTSGGKQYPKVVTLP